MSTSARFGYPLAAEHTRMRLRQALRDAAEQFRIWLLDGQLTHVLAALEKQPALLADLIPVLGKPDAPLNVRLGAQAVFERYAGAPALTALIPTLGLLSAHGDARVRADACYILGLTRSVRARPYLEARLADPDADVREIAAESLAELTDA
ncbi:MAG: HEAT repeat domain-containing protein [Rhodocyclaceae bacterium]|nr:HEAT repeat domain-containing protein [Rhodocyclaceae bacterium]